MQRNCGLSELAQGTSGPIVTSNVSFWALKPLRTVACLPALSRLFHPLTSWPIHTLSGFTGSFLLFIFCLFYFMLVTLNFLVSCFALILCVCVCVCVCIYCDLTARNMDNFKFVEYRLLRYIDLNIPTSDFSIMDSKSVPKIRKKLVVSVKTVRSFVVGIHDCNV